MYQKITIKTLPITFINELSLALQIIILSLENGKSQYFDNPRTSIPVNCKIHTTVPANENTQIYTRMVSNMDKSQLLTSFIIIF